MNAYLIWYEDWGGRAEEDEIGRGSHPAQNPPPVGDDDWFILAWYFRRCSAFMREAGLLAGEIERLGLTPAAKEVFLYKLQLIHETAYRIEEREIRKKRDGRY